MPTLFRNAALAVALAAMAGNAAAEGAFAQLYAARPPAGSSFVRIVNPAATPLRVQIADGPAQEAGAAKPATTYAIVKATRPSPCRWTASPRPACKWPPTPSAR